MKSIKPGRGPSFMGGIASAATVLIGIFWTITASSMNAPIIFPLFGVVFIILGIGNTVYNFKNATSKNRYSAFDITDAEEEPDPLNTYYNRQASPQHKEKVSTEGGYCPYCGAVTAADFEFCKKCGRKLS